jgi:hypothetical protein
MAVAGPYVVRRAARDPGNATLPWHGKDFGDGTYVVNTDYQVLIQPACPGHRRRDQGASATR